MQVPVTAGEWERLQTRSMRFLARVTRSYWKQRWAVCIASWMSFGKNEISQETTEASKTRLGPNGASLRILKGGIVAIEATPPIRYKLPINWIKLMSQTIEIDSTELTTKAG
jgi:hypothetical protein